MKTSPAYVISVAARMVGMHAQTLRYYERAGLIGPSRSRGGYVSTRRRTSTGCARSSASSTTWV